MQTSVGIKGQPHPHWRTASSHGNQPRPVPKPAGQARRQCRHAVGAVGPRALTTGLVESVPGHRGGKRSPGCIWPTFHQAASTQANCLLAVCGSELCSGCHHPVGPGLSGGPLGTSRLPGGKTGCVHSGAVSMWRCQQNACSQKATCGLTSCTQGPIHCGWQSMCALGQGTPSRCSHLPGRSRLPSPPTTLLTGPARGKVWSLSAVIQREAPQGPGEPAPWDSTHRLQLPAGLPLCVG